MNKLVTLKGFTNLCALGRTIINVVNTRQAPSALANASRFFSTQPNCLFGSKNHIASTGVIQTSKWTTPISNLPFSNFTGDVSTFVSKQTNLLKIFSRSMASLYQLHKHGPHIKKRSKKSPLGGNPFMKGVVLKTLIKKPRKPNSANRKCVLLRLSNGKEMVAHVPGEGHNLQEHNVVLARCGRLQDTPGVKLKVVRGKFDCAHVIKKTGNTS